MKSIIKGLRREDVCQQSDSQDKVGEIKTVERGVFTFGEDTPTLRLKSELFDLRVGYANPFTA